MDIWDSVRDQRLDLADHIEGLTAEQWDSASLCHEWRIRDVLGHVAGGAEGAFGPGPLLSGLVRHGFNFNRWIAEDGRQRGQADPAAMLRSLRDGAANRKKPFGAPTIASLADTLIHGQDICRPLGIHRDIPEEHLVPVADFIRSSFVFGAKKRTAGLKLRASDIPWSQGDGPEVTGPAEALVMVMAGRAAGFADLSGEGKATLEFRF